MHEQDSAILKSLVSVAWADGRVSSEETELIEALLQAFQVSPQEAADLREYAKTPRALADIPLGDLSADDRRLLLQHAVLITFIDGRQSPEEKMLLRDLCAQLRIPGEDKDAQFLSYGLAEAISGSLAAFLRNSCVQAARIRILHPSGVEPYEVTISPGAMSYVYFMDPAQANGTMAVCPEADQIVESQSGLSWRLRGTSYMCQHSMRDSR